jgi:hypothetical protein
MPTGLSAGDSYAAAPTDLPGFGDIQWESMSGRDTSPAMVGGPDYGFEGFNPETGFYRIQTGETQAMPVPGEARTGMTDWRHTFNPNGPTLFIMVFALAAVGFIHARVNLKAGPAYAGGGVG